MALPEHEVEIATGRRETDGHVRVSVFAGQLLALSLEGHGERAPTLLLTLEQARKLQGALAELIPVAEGFEQQEGDAGLQAWQGAERRKTGELTGR
jgi:hypothetical protein